MLLKGLAATILAGVLLGQVEAKRRRRGSGVALSRWERFISEPRSAVLLVLFSVFCLGGGRKLLQARRARAAIAKLDEPTVTPEEVRAAADHGRAGLMELFRILGSAETEDLRDAAGEALSILWARDELVGEEEKALVRRGFQVEWKARRRYPRGIRSAIPISVNYGVPFLRDDGRGVPPEKLEWSHRVVGARRASLEVDSPWVPGRGRAEIELVPSDFDTDGPHRLVLQVRVRTVGLTGSWELALPHMPFSFEFDSRLAVDALFALPDDNRAATLAQAVRLVVPEKTTREGDERPNFMALNEAMSIRELPVLDVKAPLPCDLAHWIEVEFEGVAGRFPAGALTLSGQGERSPGRGESSLRYPIGPILPLPLDAIERPGVRRMRARLVADPDRGWADMDVRSIWAGVIETQWVDVEIVRR